MPWNVFYGGHSVEYKQGNDNNPLPTLALSPLYSLSAPACILSCILSLSLCVLTLAPFPAYPCPAAFAKARLRRP
jgi:hypothetical protein